MPPKQRDQFAANKRIAGSLKTIGFGAKIALAEHMGWQPSIVTEIIQNKRKVSADEDEVIGEWLEAELRKKQLAVPPRKPRRDTTHTKVPVVGYVAAGDSPILFAYAQDDPDVVDAPTGATNKTVAVQIRGNSLGRLFNRWYAFYNDVRLPFTDDLVGALCVVGLGDGRIMIKEIAPGTRPGYFTLLSSQEKPIRNVQIAWAARVINIAPH